MDGPYMHGEEDYHDQDDKVFTTERQEFEKNKVKLKRSGQTRWIFLTAIEYCFPCRNCQSRLCIKQAPDISHLLEHPL